jgi:hypothetical protein
VGDCLSLPSWLLWRLPPACCCCWMGRRWRHRRAPKVYPSSTAVQLYLQLYKVQQFRCYRSGLRHLLGEYGGRGRN